METIWHYTNMEDITLTLCGLPDAGTKNSITDDEESVTCSDCNKILGFTHSNDIDEPNLTLCGKPIGGKDVTARESFVNCSDCLTIIHQDDKPVESSCEQADDDPRDFDLMAKDGEL